MAVDASAGEGEVEVGVEIEGEKCCWRDADAACLMPCLQGAGDAILGGLLGMCVRWGRLRTARR